MTIETFKDNMTNIVVKLWNDEVASRRFFKLFDEKTFTQKFLNPKWHDTSLLVVAKHNGTIIGFGHAIYDERSSSSHGYITCIVVKSTFQRQKIGSMILTALENFLSKNNIMTIRQLFLDPINLEWIVPNTTNHDHPNVPGVLINSAWYFFLVNNGYKVDGFQQDAFYLNLKAYETNEPTINPEYNITLYDKTKHHGFNELFKELNNSMWAESVKNNLAKETPDPMLIIEKNGQILGWTGPLKTTSSKSNR
ncbi:MAG: GNAT family N-acetyltransferase [Acholeplasma sp.]|nr:GNAT family N-acetyltransferase [Acholeplasma sp.]